MKSDVYPLCDVRVTCRLGEHRLGWKQTNTMSRTSWSSTGFIPPALLVWLTRSIVSVLHRIFIGQGQNVGWELPTSYLTMNHIYTWKQLSEICLKHWSSNMFQYLGVWCLNTFDDGFSVFFSLYINKALLQMRSSGTVFSERAITFDVQLDGHRLRRLEGVSGLASILPSVLNPDVPDL